MHRLICYGSKQAHSSVERAGMLAGVKMRLLEPDQNLRWDDQIALNVTFLTLILNSLTGDILEAAIAEDRDKGLIPFCCISTLGTTSSCAYDHILSLGPVCRDQVSPHASPCTGHTVVLYMYRVYGSMWMLPMQEVPSSAQSSVHC